MLLNLGSWWQSVAFFEKIFWIIAILFSSLFLIQTVMSMFGGADDVSGDADDYAGDDDGIGYQFFTIKNMIAFFTLFGWVGIAANNSGVGKAGTILLALAAGTAIVLVMALLLKNVHRLKHDGTLQVQNAIGQTGNTYLFIPPKRSGQGKVHIKVQGSLKELPAMTDDDMEIPTGRFVKVTGVINDRILLVTLVKHYDLNI